MFLEETIIEEKIIRENMDSIKDYTLGDTLKYQRTEIDNTFEEDMSIVIRKEKQKQKELSDLKEILAKAKEDYERIYTNKQYNLKSKLDNEEIKMLDILVEQLEDFDFEYNLGKVIGLNDKSIIYVIDYCWNIRSKSHLSVFEVLELKRGILYLERAILNVKKYLFDLNNEINTCTSIYKDKEMKFKALLKSYKIEEWDDYETESNFTFTDYEKLLIEEEKSLSLFKEL